MKKLIIFVIILIASILNARVIEHSYYFEDPIIEEKGEYSTINFEGTTQMGIVGKPTLPFQAVKLGLQQYEIADRIEIIGLNPIFLEEEINLFPRQHSRPLSDKREMKFEIDNNFYQSNAKYPQKSYTHINTEFFHGNPIALSTITPVEYNSREKQLTYFSEMVVKIYTKTNNKNLNIPEILNSKIVKNYVDNPEDIPYSSRTREVNIEIIVITPAEFIDDFAGYQDFYSQKGYNVEMYGVETIYANYEGVDNQEKIRNFIIEQYNENQMEFVLLGGDIEHIPVRGFFCSVQSSQVYEDENIPSDLYYSALDGSWNDDNDELWGEIGEDDLLPEVSVGRLPFSNVNELENMLTKLFSYQNNPVIEDLDKPLLAGEYLYDDPITWGADYLEMLVGYHEEHGYQTNGIPEDSDYYTLFERDVDSWSGADLINSLEEGSSFLHHVGHANQYYVAHLQSSDITDENFSEINGIDNNHTIMYTHGCICGSFDTDDCIAEEMLKIENFAVGFIGNSRYGWFNEGQTEGPSGHIHREFVDAIYGDKTAAIGKAHKESKYDTAPFVTAEDQWEEGALRWCFYDCNVLADPAMKVWTDQLIEPEIITNEVIPMGIESHMITVQNEGTNLENIHCALIIDNEIFASAVTDEDGVAFFQFGSEFQNPSLGTIVVDGYNLVTTSHEVYIVNDDEPLLSLTNFESISPFIPNTNVSFDLEIENITSTDAEMVEVEISTENEFLTIINSVEEIEIINGLSSVTLTDVFEIAVSEIIPDGTEIEINIEIYTGEIAFYESFVSVAQAPQIVINSVSLLDNEGNNNGTIDANENFTLELGIKNIGHYSAEEISVSYNSITNLISLLSEEDVFCGEIQPDSLNSISYDFYATDDIEIGDQINFQFLLSWGAYQDFNSIHTISGASVESFESGYNSFDWNFEDNITWQISTTESVDGNLSSYSRDIDDNEITSMWLTTNTMGAQPVSFYYKVSSEATYDFFNFYIDEQLQNSWSGEIEWEFVQFEVPAGEHILKWEYTKDGMVSEGEDKVWIDMITLPTMIEISENENDVIIPKISQINKIYPNPFNPKTTILFSNSQTENVRIDVFNIRGQLVNMLINQQFTKGNHSIVWDGEDDSSNEVSSGVYFVRFKSDSNVSLNKIMLLK